MSAWVGDVATPVAYTSDKRNMDRIPWALWLIALGVAVALNTGGRHGKGAAVALVYMALLALAIGAYFVMHRVDNSSIPFLATIPIFIILAIAVEFVIYATTGSTGRSGTQHFGPSFWTSMINPPVHVGGWLMAYLGASWIAGTIYRHVYPPKPTLMLSPAGVALHQFWLPELLIPWHEITAISAPQGQGLLANKHVAAVEVGQDFYERHIAPKLGILVPPNANGMVIPNGDKTLVVLTTSERTDDVEATRAAVASRWKAFRDQTSSAPQAGAAPAAPTTEPVVNGLWSYDGSLWRTVLFVAPLLTLAIVVIHAAVWGR